MIQLATALPAITVGPVKPNAAIAADAGGFALALDALMPGIAAPPIPSPPQPGEVPVLPPMGQESAEGGKELPDAVPALDGKAGEQAGSDAEQDGDAAAEDAPPPPFAWFAAAPAPAPAPEPGPEADAPLPIMRGDAGGKAPAHRENMLPPAVVAETGTVPDGKAKAERAAARVAAEPDAPVAPEARPQPEAAAQAPALRRRGAESAPPVAPAPSRTVPAPGAARGNPAVDPAVDPAMADLAAAAVAQAEPAKAADAPGSVPPQPVLAPAPRELRRAAAEAPVVRIALDRPAPPQKVSIADVTQGRREAPAAPPPAAVPQPGVALEPARPGAPARAPGDSQPDLSTLAAPATGTQTILAASAAGASQDAALDMRHQQWTAKMMDRIETLRDAAPARETRLSLMPEALGKVDIAIRQDDAGIHVQFHTESQAARQLIADAQPRLAEIAEQRGIRLGSTSVESNATGTGTGTGAGPGNPQTGQGERHDAAPNRHQPLAAPAARREARASTHDDERVA
ncbi:flagellar hook-length control protein FliK [Sphingomonas sp. CBMAI 2297]|uniref:flagellar hook-length control protein FliK n=1 Tax=Sphingomonas sp. CBMAI 2297 TaxID=2991720 RepID=UPI002457D1B7|nr:flagellar hook-length control protein FliK [Sphingomonas sp. CBMAI 2297]MDH4746374.1 flagellar hook-length control protein FliK [Sphingomonas sp. CBMAI 2297]